MVWAELLEKEKTNIALTNYLISFTEENDGSGRRLQKDNASIHTDILTREQIKSHKINLIT